MNLFKTITMLFYPAAKRSCCHRNFELKIEFLDSKPMEIKMGKYLFLYKWLITQSVACFNYGIIFVYYVYIADNFVFLILIYIDSHFLLLWNIGNWRWIWLGTILLLILLGHFVVSRLDCICCHILGIHQLFLKAEFIWINKYRAIFW